MFGAIRLKLYHQVGSQPASLFHRVDAAVPTFRWQTCLRSLALVPDDSGLAGEWPGEWLEGEAAYRRLLEIVCGLHSPLVGETEVFGQFKDAIQERLASSSGEALEVAFTATLRHWAKALIEDVKLVRQKHLLDLGSQSYGSLVRREVREMRRPQIEFLGSGHLALEIMPWLLKALKKEARVVVHARNPEKARARVAEIAMTKAHDALSFSDILNGPGQRPFDSQRVLIIAAPMASRDIVTWIGDSAFDLVIDLRGEGRLDPLNDLVAKGLTGKLRSLDEVFSSIELAKGLVDQKKTAALALIDECVEARLATAIHRPFGWDDVWS